MALPEDFIVVEDASGLVVNSNSFIDLAYFNEYCLIFNNTKALAATDETKVAAILKAAMYLNSLRYKGSRLIHNQTMEFPRDGVYVDNMSLQLPSNIIPTNVKKAQAEAAMLTIEGANLLPAIDASQFVVRERVGPIDTTYSDAAKYGIKQRFASVDALLREYLYNTLRVFAMRA